MSRQPPNPLGDQAARNRIATDLGATLFVEAGAGSGKTRALVERIAALVTTEPTVPMSTIAAVTFTEKAAAELRDRIRERLEQARDESGDFFSAGRIEEALNDIDGAAIGTVHAFAHRILREQALRAGLPPKVDVLDEISSGIAFDDRWIGLREELLNDDGLRRSVLLLESAGVPLDRLRDVARAFDDNWDLVDDGAVPGDWAAEPDPIDVGGPFEMAANLATMGSGCLDPDDKLLQRVHRVAEVVDGLRRSSEDSDLLEGLSVIASIRPGNFGKKENWPGDDKKAVIDQLNRLRTAAENIRRLASQQAARHIAHHIAGTVLEAADERRRRGELRFHDLLVLARRMIRDPEDGPIVRAELRERYQRILLDEFQDTDPIQFEIALAIAGLDGAPADGSPGDGSPGDGSPGDGRLFVVGDPKQSIYRFRRADIATFLAAREQLAPDGPVVLDSNFRSTEPVIDWVNLTFGSLISGQPGAQPDYQPLVAVRPGAPSGPSIGLLGVEPHPPSDDHGRVDAGDLRRREADDVAAAVVTALEEEWPVDDGQGGWRPCRPGDICILLPSRLGLSPLEDALDNAGIVYRTESSSLVYSSTEVRELLLAARAVDDPGDELAIISTLRSPLFGCTDAELASWRLDHGGRWSLLTPPPESAPVDHPVGRALDELRELSRQATWTTPSAVLDDLATRRRSFELATAGRRPRDVWRRLRFVIDQARAYTEAQGSSLRDYLRWAARQASESTRVSEAVLPETDDDAVRIMTIHAAKGLQFPITVLSGMTTRRRGRSAGVQVVFPPGRPCGLALGKDVTTDEFEEFAPIDEQLDEFERRRLLYVAATRAQDHLVLSLHRIDRTIKDPEKTSHAELLANATITSDDASRALTLLERPPAPTPRRHHPQAEVVARPVWQSRMDEVRTSWKTNGSLAATTLAKSAAVPSTAAPPTGSPPPTGSARSAAASDDPGLDKDARDLDLPPWNRGRYGTAVGRAVHGTLQLVDLASGDGLEEIAEAQAEAEGVSHLSGTIAELGRSAIASPVIEEAARLPHWREFYVAAPIGRRLIEGYVDLAVRTNTGLVIIDYKTDAVPEDRLPELVARYRLQCAAYAYALGQATGLPVTRSVLLFLGLERAVDREVPDLAGAIKEVKALAPTFDPTDV